jgi:hypothetical protein
MLLMRVCTVVFPLFLLCVECLGFFWCYRMCAVYYYRMHLLEMVAPHCRFSYHSYLCDVGGDGSVLGGVELEIDGAREGATPTRFFLDFRVSWFMMPVRGVSPASCVLLAEFVWVRSRRLYL